jgi:prepilin-type N-terminal cleavage/methylation domain-containing protein
MQKIFQKNKGFTLVELIVVMSIISLLASVVLVNINGYLAKARDARRKIDLQTLATAVRMYETDNNHLPRSTGWCTYISNSANNWGPDFQNDIKLYLPKTPLDPILANSVGDYLYYNTDDANGHYTLCAILENSTGNAYDYRGCAGGSIYNYCISY